MATYSHCSECGCDMFELQEVEAEMCTECQKGNELFNPDVPRPTGEIDVRGEFDAQLK